MNDKQKYILHQTLIVFAYGLALEQRNLWAIISLCGAFICAASLKGRAHKTQTAVCAVMALFMIILLLTAQTLTLYPLLAVCVIVSFLSAGFCTGLDEAVYRLPALGETAFVLIMTGLLRNAEGISLSTLWSAFIIMASLAGPTLTLYAMALRRQFHGGTTEAGALK